MEKGRTPNKTKIKKFGRPTLPFLSETSTFFDPIRRSNRLLLEAEQESEKIPREIMLAICLSNVEDLQKLTSDIIEEGIENVSAYYFQQRVNDFFNGNLEFCLQNRLFSIEILQDLTNNILDCCLLFKGKNWNNMHKIFNLLFLSEKYKLDINIKKYLTEKVGTEISSENIYTFIKLLENMDHDFLAEVFGYVSRKDFYQTLIDFLVNYKSPGNIDFIIQIMRYAHAFKVNIDLEKILDQFSLKKEGEEKIGLYKSDFGFEISTILLETELSFLLVDKLDMEDKKDLFDHLLTSDSLKNVIPDLRLFEDLFKLEDAWILETILEANTAFTLNMFIIYESLLEYNPNIDIRKIFDFHLKKFKISTIENIEFFINRGLDISEEDIEKLFIETIELKISKQYESQRIAAMLVKMLEFGMIPSKKMTKEIFLFFSTEKRREHTIFTKSVSIFLEQNYLLMGLFIYHGFWKIGEDLQEEHIEEIRFVLAEENRLDTLARFEKLLAGENLPARAIVKSKRHEMIKPIEGSKFFEKIAEFYTLISSLKLINDIEQTEEYKSGESITLREKLFLKDYKDLIQLKIDILFDNLKYQFLALVVDRSERYGIKVSQNYYTNSHQTRFIFNELSEEQILNIIIANVGTWGHKGQSPNWLVIGRTAYNFWKEKPDKINLLDTCFAMVHNGGTIFNRAFFETYSADEKAIQQILEIKRSRLSFSEKVRYMSSRNFFGKDNDKIPLRTELLLRICRKLGIDTDPENRAQKEEDIFIRD